MISDDVTMPTGVDSIFVPPDGAMQFEVHRDNYGNLAPHGTVIWVFPSNDKWVPMSHLCPHVHGYEVIMESLPYIMRSRSGMKKAGVCECWGSIIE